LHDSEHKARGNRLHVSAEPIPSCTL